MMVGYGWLDVWQVQGGIAMRTMDLAWSRQARLDAGQTFESLTEVPRFLRNRP
jgi:hypothetical protein